MQHRFSLIAVGIASLAAFSAQPATAQTLINQDSVIRGVGFPLVLNTPGSYKLTSNIQTGTGSPAIEITAPDVTLDLNGFTVSSLGTCTFNPNYTVTCHNAANSEVGIKSTAGGAVIMNGNVRGFHIGVWHYAGDHLERLHVSHNHTGVRSLSTQGARTLIRDVRVELNRDEGFDVSDVVIQDSTAARNGGNGFQLNRASVHESAAYFNYGSGFWGNTHSAISRSDAYSNGVDNISSTVKSMGGNRNGEVAY